MKISEFIAKLQKYQDERGDLEMLFSVRDYYSRYGYDATHTIKGEFWENTTSNGQEVRFEVHLKSEEYPNEPKRKPKVTFRK